MELFRTWCPFVLRRIQLLQDGSFEAENGRSLNCYAYASGTDWVSGGYWSFTTGAGTMSSGCSPWGGSNAYDGANFAFLQGIQGVSATLTGLVPGATYTLAWWMSGRTGFGGANDLNLNVSNAKLYNTPIINLALGWVHANASWKQPASISTASVAFFTTNPLGADATTFLDYVTLASSTPPPLPPPLPPPPSPPPPSLAPALTSSSSVPLHRYALSGSSWIDTGSAPIPANLYGGAAPLQGTGLYFPPAGTPYACMPALALGGTDVSLAAWVSFSTLTSWARVFDLGVGSPSTACTGPGDSSNYIDFASAGGTSTAHVGLRLGGGTESSTSITSFWAPGAWTHVLLTVPLSLAAASVYKNGALAGSIGAPLPLLSSPTVFYNAFLGRSQSAPPVASDSYLNGLIAEFVW